MFTMKIVVLVSVLIAAAHAIGGFETQFYNDELMELMKGFEPPQEDSSIEKREIANAGPGIPLLSVDKNVERGAHYWTRLRSSNLTRSSFDFMAQKSPNSLDATGKTSGKARRSPSDDLPAEAAETTKSTAEMLADVDLKEKPLPPRKFGLPAFLNSRFLEKAKEVEHQALTTQGGQSIFVVYTGQRAMCCNSSDILKEPHKINHQQTHIRKECFQEIKERREKFLQDTDTEESSEIFNIFSCDRVNRTKIELMCLVDCVGKKNQIVNKNGVFNVELAKEYMRQFHAGHEWEQTASDKLVEKCVNEVSTGGIQRVHAYGEECNLQMAKFSYCMWKEYFLSCPLERQQGSLKRCNKLREKLLKKNEKIEKVEKV